MGSLWFYFDHRHDGRGVILCHSQHRNSFSRGSEVNSGNGNLGVAVKPDRSTRAWVIGTLLNPQWCITEGFSFHARSRAQIYTFRSNRIKRVATKNRFKTPRMALGAVFSVFESRGTVGASKSHRDAYTLEKRPPMQAFDFQKLEKLEKPEKLEKLSSLETIAFTKPIPLLFTSRAQSISHNP